MGPFAEWVTSTRATPADVDALRGHRSRSGGRLFDDAFCDWFGAVDFSGLRIDAVPEGRVVHPNTPITVVEGPLAAAQLLETPLLNQLNFATLIATKAARVVEASRGRPVLEFGMRRAAADGADAASRAAIVGGATSTSNSAVAYELGLTPAGTHAHSMVQLFIALGGGEEDAFDAYADVYPDDTLLLVDTVDTLGSGIPNAIATFERLRRAGHEPVGIRLDSGDLAYLAVQAARELDRAGFPDTAIVLSSQLDELTIWQITSQIADEARRHGIDPDAVIGRLVFGVGSRLATSDGDPSLDGVFKLVAVDDGAGAWRPAMKRSDSPVKVLNPGAKRLWRVYDDDGRAVADVLSTADEELRPGEQSPPPPRPARRLADADDGTCRRAAGDRGRRREGRRRRRAVTSPPRPTAPPDVEALDPGVRRLVNPHTYHVSITDDLFALKRSLLAGFTLRVLTTLVPAQRELSTVQNLRLRAEQAQDVVVGGRREVEVPLPDGAERRRLQRAHQLVGERGELGARVGRPDRDGDDDPRRLRPCALPGRRHASSPRSPGRRRRARPFVPPSAGIGRSPRNRRSCSASSPSATAVRRSTSSVAHAELPDDVVVEDDQPPDATAPMASSTWCGAPILRTVITSRWPPSRSAIGAATGTPPRGSPSTTGSVPSSRPPSSSASTRPASARSRYSPRSPHVLHGTTSGRAMPAREVSFGSE